MSDATHAAVGPGWTQLVESLPFAVIVVGEHGRIALANALAEGLLGFAPGELVGQALECVVPHEHRSGHAQRVSAYAARPGVRVMGQRRFVTALCKDGRRIPVEVGLSPMQTELGAFTVAAIVDASARLEHEQRLESFAQVASHDLKAPLRQVASFAQLLARELGGELQGRQRMHLDFMVGALQRLHRTVDALLASSRSDAAVSALEPVDLDAVLRETVALLAGEISDAAASLHVEALPQVMGSPDQLALVLQNLVTNALKFRHPDRNPVIQVRGARHGARARIEIEDNGIGFEPHQAEEIFEMFRRGGSGASHAGSGIGLATVRRVIHAHGGRVWCTARPNAGACFYLELAAAGA